MCCTAVIEEYTGKVKKHRFVCVYALKDYAGMELQIHSSLTILVVLRPYRNALGKQEMYFHCQEVNRSVSVDHLVS